MTPERSLPAFIVLGYALAGALAYARSKLRDHAIGRLAGADRRSATGTLRAQLPAAGVPAVLVRSLVAGTTALWLVVALDVAEVVTVVVRFVVAPSVLVFLTRLLGGAADAGPVVR